MYEVPANAGVDGGPLLRLPALALEADGAQHAPHGHQLQPHVQRRVVPQAHRLREYNTCIEGYKVHFCKTTLERYLCRV